MNLLKRLPKFIFVLLFILVFAFFIFGFDSIMEVSPTAGIVVVLLIGLIWALLDLIKTIKNKKKHN